MILVGSPFPDNLFQYFIAPIDFGLATATILPYVVLAKTVLFHSIPILGLFPDTIAYLAIVLDHGQNNDAATTGYINNRRSPMA